MFGFTTFQIGLAVIAVVGVLLALGGGDKAWSWVTSLKVPSFIKDKVAAEPTRDAAYHGIEVALAYMVLTKNKAGIEAAQKLGAQLFAIPTEGT